MKRRDSLTLAVFTGVPGRASREILAATLSLAEISWPMQRASKAIEEELDRYREVLSSLGLFERREIAAATLRKRESEMMETEYDRFGA